MLGGRARAQGREALGSTPRGAQAAWGVTPWMVVGWGLWPKL